VLDDLDQVPVCVAYRVNGKTVDTMPATEREIEAIEPVYEILPGWKSPTRGMSQWESLPARARDYLKFLESSTGVEVGCVSTGPERNQTMILAGSKDGASASLAGPIRYHGCRMPGDWYSDTDPAR